MSDYRELRLSGRPIPYCCPYRRWHRSARAAADAILLCTEGGRALGAVAREMGIVHRPVNLAQGIRVIAGVYHVQNINAYDSRLKEWMRRFHGVATRHLANYLGWRRLIERSHNAPPPRAVLLAALGMNQVQQLTVT